MPGKKLLASKTMWFNVASIALVAVQYLQGAPWFSPEAQAVIVAVCNAVLRLCTDQPIATLGKAGRALVLALALPLLAGGCFGLTRQTGDNITPQQQALAVIGSVEKAAEQFQGSSAAVADIIQKGPLTLADQKMASNFLAWANFAAQAAGIVVKVAAPLL